MSLINHDNFYTEVLLFCQGQAKKSDGLGVIISDPTSDLAKVWIGYAHAKGWDHRAQMWAQMLKSGSKLTMPCANPRHFDPAFVPVPRKAEDRGVTSATPEERRAVVERAKARVASASRPPNDRRNDWEPPKMTTRQQAEAALQAALDNPTPAPPLSEEARSKLGIRPQSGTEAAE